MYNKLFAKILDSSIWLETDGTRIVWVTLLAAMDEDGFAAFASVPNVAHRARVSLKVATAALTTLESADPHSSDPDHGGKRIERVPGGWVVLNAPKYRAMASRQDQRVATRERVARYRSKNPTNPRGNAPVTGCNATPESVTPSEAYTEADTDNPPTPLANAKGVRVTRAHKKHAAEVLRLRFGRCQHEPTCADYAACLTATARELAEKAS